jgi:hypothetical protein
MAVNYLVPWRDDNLLWSASPLDPTVEWRPNIPFTATLCVSDQLPVYKSKASHSLWMDKQRHEFPMLYVELLRALQLRPSLTDGWLTGNWDVRKVGTSYSLRYLER